MDLNVTVQLLNNFFFNCTRLNCAYLSGFQQNTSPSAQPLQQDPCASSYTFYFKL